MAKANIELFSGIEEIALRASRKSHGPLSCFVNKQGDGIGHLVPVIGKQSPLGEEGVQLMQEGLSPPKIPVEVREIVQVYRYCLDMGVWSIFWG